MAKKAASDLVIEPSAVPLGGYVHVQGSARYRPGGQAVPEGVEAALVVEVIYPNRTVVYEAGPGHGDGDLSFRFPVIEAGTALIRIFDGANPETRTILGSGSVEVTA